MRKSVVKDSTTSKFSPIQKEPRIPFKLPSNYSTGFLYGLVILFILVFTLMGLLIWNIIVTQQLASAGNGGSSSTTGEPSYNPVIFQVLTSNSISLEGSTLNGNSPVYQYVGLQKGELPLIDSVETPHTSLPLFSSLFTTATFNGNTIGNGDIITHAYYSVSSISDAVNPLAAVYFVYYQSCFQYANTTNLCWTGTDFCSYPIIINFASPTQVTLNNFAEVLAYAQQHFDSNVRANPSNGCFYVTMDKDLLNDQIITQISQNISTIDPPSSSAFILTLGSQLGTRVFKLCTTAYTVDYYASYTAAQAYYDFYIDYGDGTATEHHVGMLGVGNPITHTYSPSAPTLVNVTILGIVPGWCCLNMHEAGGGVNPMTRDIISWGNVSMTQANFYYESNMLAISAGSPAPSMEGFLFFFPDASSTNVWANLNTWDVSNIVEAVGMFYYKTTGVLDLRGWALPKLKNAAQMFIGVTIPIIGNLTDMTLDSLESSQQMFQEYAGGPISLPNVNLGSLIIANYMFWKFASTEVDVSRFNTTNVQESTVMFSETRSFPNVNVTYWDTRNLKKINSMFFGCVDAKPIFTYWDMQNITECSNVLNNHTITGGMSNNADYNQILIDFESKTNSTGLICDWGLHPLQQIGSINGVATTSPALTARTNLINRGWDIADLTP